jgi:hypothetical protein
MSQLDEEQFDAMMGGFFKDALNPQLGRSERTFRRHLNEALRSAWRQRTWVIGAFATGMAASVAMLWAVPAFRTASPSPAPAGMVSQASTGSNGATIPEVERVVQSHTTDEGVMVLGDDTPVRVLHRQRLEQTRWLNDPQHARQEQGVPQDEMVFIKMPTY